MWLVLSSSFHFLLFGNSSFLKWLFWLLKSSCRCGTLWLSNSCFCFFIIFWQWLIILITNHILQIIRVNFHIFIFLYNSFRNYFRSLQRNYSYCALNVHKPYYLISFTILNLNYLFLKGETVCLNITLWAYMPNFELFVKSNCY